MLIEVIIHAVLQLMIMSAYFWVYLVPSIQKQVSSKVTNMMSQPVLSTLQGDCTLAAVVKSHLTGKQNIYASSDPVMKSTNRVLFVANMIFVGVLVAITMSYVFAYHWNKHSSAAMGEVFLTYAILLAIQVWFTNLVSKFMPYTKDEMNNIIVTAANTYCVT